MPRPSSADLLAYQLQQAAQGKAGRTSPLPLSAPPSAQFGYSPASSSESSAPSPSTPATPWLNDFQTAQPSWGTQSKRQDPPVGLGIIDVQAPSVKPVVRTALVVADPDDETDEELEAELNDFGYGAPKRRKEKKESLLDILNSDPPDWMVQTPSAAVLEPESAPAIAAKRSGTFSSKIRQRFGSQAPDGPAVQSDSYAAFSTLRTSRSAGNLLSSLRGRLGSNVSNRSRDDLAESGAPSLASVSRTSLPQAPAYGSYMPQVPAPPVSQKKLAAKEADYVGGSTRDLADFLRSSGPPVLDDFGFVSPDMPRRTSEARSFPSKLHKARGGSASLKSRSSRPSHVRAASSNGSGNLVITPASYRSTASPALAAEGAPGGVAAVRAAMVKLSSHGRRASLLHAAAAPPASIRPPTLDRQPSSEGSDAHSGTIRVDDTFLEAMFGRPAGTGPRARAASADAASVMGVMEFVSRDERDHGCASKEGGADVERLPVETRAGEMRDRAAAAVRAPPAFTRTSSQSSAHLPFGSPSRVASPQRVPRKPVPAAIPPIEELLDPSPPRRAPVVVKAHAIDRSVDESPVKGSIDLDAPPRSAKLAPDTPLSPSSTIYATPPGTPTPPRHEPASPTSSSRTHTPVPERYIPLVEQSLKAPRLVRPTTGSSAATGLSVVSSTLSRGASASPDSLMDPSLSTATTLATLVAVPTAAGVVIDRSATVSAAEDPLVSALEALQRCMQQAAAIPVAVEALAAAHNGHAMLQAIAPTLQGFGEQMRLGAQLVDEVVARVQALPADQEVAQARGCDAQVGEVAEALLAGEGDGFAQVGVDGHQVA